jgi:hypothetical protein
MEVRPISVEIYVSYSVKSSKVICETISLAQCIVYFDFDVL